MEFWELEDHEVRYGVPAAFPGTRPDSPGESRCCRLTPLETYQSSLLGYKIRKRDLKICIAEERKLHRNVCWSCTEYADHRPGCPMRRPSRSPNFKRTPWVWYHGDGRCYCTDLHSTPYQEQLAENDYEETTPEEVSRPITKDDQQVADEYEDDVMAEEVDPTEAAPAGYASMYSDVCSLAADVACDTGTFIDLEYAVTEEVDLSP
eukprot:8523711-Pyramimonas_sp.AAC.1